MNKTIVITGTSNGIGKVLAEYFASRGHRVYGLSRSSSKATFYTDLPCDITDKDSIQKAIETIMEKEKNIHLLINNAGRGMVGPIEDATKEEIHMLFDLNLIGSIQMMQAVLPNMRQNKYGQIINISSIGSEMGLPFRGLYSASKSALDKTTEAMRYEVISWNIQICSLHLGDIKTNIAENRVASNVSEPYKYVFNRVFSGMNAHVDQGIEPIEVAYYIEQLMAKKEWKAHYYFGKLGQKIGIPLKWILPQKVYENLMKKYSNI